MRRRDGEIWPETAVLLPRGGPVLYLVSAFEPGLHRKLVTCERLTYLTFKDAEADGWRVD